MRSFCANGPAGNEFTAEDLDMVNAFFNQSVFKAQSLHQQYLERCREKNSFLTARAKAFASVLNAQHDAVTKQPLNKALKTITSVVQESNEIEAPSSELPPRRKTIKRKRRKLRLTIEHMKRNLLKRNLARQVHKQNCQSSEAIMVSIFGPVISEVGNVTDSKANETDSKPGIQVFPEGLETEEYHTWKTASNELAETRNSLTKHFPNQTIFVILGFPVLLSSHIKGKLKALGGLLVFNKHNAAVFCTIFESPLVYRKQINTIINVCVAENHSFVIIFAGNRYICPSTSINRLRFKAIQCTNLSINDICEILRLNTDSSSHPSVVNGIKESISCAFHFIRSYKRE